MPESCQKEIVNGFSALGVRCIYADVFEKHAASIPLVVLSVRVDLSTYFSEAYYATGLFCFSIRRLAMRSPAHDVFNCFIAQSEDLRVPECFG